MFKRFQWETAVNDKRILQSMMAVIKIAYPLLIKILASMLCVESIQKKFNCRMIYQCFQ